jgi:hypothetical protein
MPIFSDPVKYPEDNQAQGDGELQGRLFDRDGFLRLAMANKPIKANEPQKTTKLLQVIQFGLSDEKDAPGRQRQENYR